MPQPLIFLGQNCLGGVSDDLKNRLVNVELSLRQTFQSLGVPGTFEDWCGMREQHRAAHSGGNHTLGNALDVNFLTDPYIATRSRKSNGGVEYGGESSTALNLPSIRAMRVLATVVYDRALAFL